MKKSARLLSAILIVVLFTAQLNALTVKAAQLDEKNAAAITDAIQYTQQLKKSPKKDYFTTMSDGSTRFVKALAITNLAKPIHGQMLDQSATVVTDTGVSWEIPVIWVNKDGDIIHLAIEIDDIVKSYPIFVFYMPDGYSLVLGENSGYDIQMPDFVVDLMKINGVTTLSIPESGMTYISAVLPEMEGFKVNPETPSDDTNTSESENQDNSDVDNKDDEHEKAHDNPGPNPDNPGPDPDPDPNPNNEEPYLTPETDNDKTPPATNLTYEENLKLVEAHCDDNVISIIGVDKLAALVNWVKNTLEPEAVNLLTSKFSAFKKASEKGELGKDIGLYVYYDTYYEEDGSTKEDSRSLASVDIVSDSSGNVKYRLSVNAGGFYERNPETGDYEFNKSDSYSDLDNTLVHEMMHAFMADYTRTGVTGWEYDKSDGTYDLAAEDDIKFPKWFSEGVASTVENTFQYWKDEFYQYFNNDNNSLFSESEMKKSYKNNPEFNLNGSDEESDYITGYLACLYLSYLRAKQDNKEAITGSLETKDLRVDSSVLREGLNSILEDLHSGKTLDDVIAKASKVDGNSLYKNTQDFEEKFIINDTTDKESLKFCTDLLNYMHNSSSGKKTANGSLLIDFSDTNTTQLSKSQLKNKQQSYTITEDSYYADSTVNKKNALKSGGTSGTGITSSSGSDKAEAIDGDFVISEQAAKINNKVSESTDVSKASEDSQVSDSDKKTDVKEAGSDKDETVVKDSEKNKGTDNSSENKGAVKLKTIDGDEALVEDAADSEENQKETVEEVVESSEESNADSDETVETTELADTADEEENISSETSEDGEETAAEPLEDEEDITNVQEELADIAAESENVQEDASEVTEESATEQKEAAEVTEDFTNEQTEVQDATEESVNTPSEPEESAEPAEAVEDSAVENEEVSESVEEPQEEAQETVEETESNDSSQDSEETESAEESVPAEEDTSDDEVVSEPEESNEISENPIVISETEEPEPESNDDNCEEVLDAYPEDNSDDSEDAVNEKASD